MEVTGASVVGGRVVGAAVVVGAAAVVVGGAVVVVAGFAVVDDVDAVVLTTLTNLFGERLHRLPRGVFRGRRSGQ